MINLEKIPVEAGEHISGLPFSFALITAWTIFSGLLASPRKVSGEPP